MNFIECKTADEANKINLEIYTFVKHSDTRDVYIFKLRARK